MKRNIGARVFCVAGGVALLLGVVLVPRLQADDESICYGQGPLCSRVVTTTCSGNTCTVLEQFYYHN
jgi:hypothetical protein